MVSNGPSKPTVCVPGMKPARVDAVSIGAVYTTLRRLQRKGFVSSQLGDPSPSRGGRAKKYFTLEPEGLEALQRSREMFASLWRDVPEAQ